MQALKDELTGKIKELKRVSDNEKFEYIELIEKAYTESEVRRLYEKIVEIDANKKVFVKYQIKNVDIDTGEVLSSSLKTFAETGEVINAKADRFEGYKLLSEEEQSVQIDAEDVEIVFEHRKVQQSKYVIRYKADGKEIIPAITKIDFSGNTVSEKADRIKGYVLISDEVQSIDLKPSDNEDIVFVYRKVDEKALKTAIDSAIKQIGLLKKATDNIKIEYIELVKKANTVQEVNELLKAVRKIDAETIVSTTYLVKYVTADGETLFPSVTKIDFVGKVVEEQPIPSNDPGLATPKSKRLVLDSKKQNIIEFVYYAYEDEISIADFVKMKLDPKGVQSPYRSTDFTNDPEGLMEFVTKSVYHHAFLVEFTATDDDVDHLYRHLWNKATDASLVRLARKWTPRSEAKVGKTEVEGVNKYSITLSYDASIADVKAAEDEIDKIIERYNLLNLDDFSKVKTIHDYLTKHITPNPNPNEYGLNRYNHTMVFLQKTGVCEGYSMAFNRLAERAGLPSKFVPGSVRVFANIKVQMKYWKPMLDRIDTDYFDSKLNHSWNQVKIEDKWYHLDSYHASFYYHHPEYGEDPYYAFLKSQNYLWNVLRNRIWNPRYTEPSNESYEGNFQIDESI